MAPLNPHEGDTLVRVHFSVPGENVRAYEYLNCYGFYNADRFFVRSYNDDPGMPARASFLSEHVLIAEHQGKHEARQVQKPPKRTVEAPAAPPTALPDDEASEAAMERFLAAAPPAESHLPERKFLESAEGEAAPKEEWSIAGTSLSDQKAVATPSGGLRIPLPENIPGTPLSPTKYLPMETQPEEVERRIKEFRPKVELAKEVTHGVAIPSTAGPEMNFEGSFENRETRRSKAKGTTSKAARARGTHARPKPSGPAALSAVALPLLGFFLAAFRVRMG